MKYLSLLILTAFTGILSAQTHRITLNPAFRPFYHGVESGDPKEDGVIIWTRVTPDSGTTGDVEVYWQVATDVNFTNIVNYGKTTATEANSYCVKEDVCGLLPSTYYYYMFNALGRNSVVGRTKTAAGATADNDSVRFAVMSCASWEHGYFNAYESVSNRNDIDAVVFLGDYIYEYESGGFSSNIAGRTYDPPAEAITEIGYELRYSQYKLDDKLRRIHQLFPFITVWDDHETANNAWREGAQNHTPGTEGNYTDRKHGAVSAYFKWMPLRKPDPNDTIRIFRKLRYGKLLDLVMLDTRLYDRDEQDLNLTNDPNHHMMGSAERAWFLAQLSDTTTRWKIIGNQTMFAPLEILGQPAFSDQWDGYNYERGLIQNHILNNNIKDVVILTGDIHTSWCNDVPGANYDANTGAGSVCVEFVGASVTSLNSPLPIGASLIRTLNPHMKYINLDDNGYYILDVKKTKAQADYTFLSTVTQQTYMNVDGPRFFMNHNERHLREATQAVAAPTISAPNPPLQPSQSIPFYKITDHYLTTPENTQVSANVIPSLQSCPAKTMTIIQGQHGFSLSLNGQNVTYVPSANYHGSDTVALVICSATLPPVCDTVYLFITVTSVQDVDTIVVNLEGDSTYTGCIHFNDLTSSPSVINHTMVMHGTFGLNDSCFIYTPDSSFCGNETIVFTACDGVDCDTVVYVIRVDRPVFASVVELTLNKNSNTTYCLVFDDLITEPVSMNATLLPHHGTYQMQGDSCVKYSPYFNYVGNDTMRFVACDTCGINHCDTITVIFHVQEPNAVEETNSLVVFGMYPNPVNDRLTVQYYLHEAIEVTVNLYDVQGKLIHTEYEQRAEGLHHIQLNTQQLSIGKYVVELKTAKGDYRKTIIKE